MAATSWLIARWLHIDCAMPNRTQMLRMLGLCVVVPMCVNNIYLYQQLVWLGNLLADQFWLTLGQGQLSDLLVFLAAGVPLCAFVTPLLRRANLASRSLLADPGERDEVDCAPSGRDRYHLLIALIAIFVLAIFIPMQQYWYLYAVPILGIALSSGHRHCVVAVSWMFLLVLVLPAYSNGRFGATWRFDANHVAIYLNLCTLALATLITGRTISDLRLESQRREEAVRSLERQEQLLTAFVDNSPSIIYMKDEHGRYMLVNRAFEQVANRARQQLIGQTCQGIMPPDISNLFRSKDADAFRLGVTPPFEFSMTLVSGPHQYLGITFAVSDHRGNHHAVCGIATDITERKRIEQSLLQSQKVESIGRLAGGVAHDFNNLLTAILGFADILRARLEPGSPHEPVLDRIIDAAQRGSSLTQQLLGYARRQVASHVVLDLNEHIARSIELLHRLIGEDIELLFIPAPKLHPVKADPVQIEQILINLAVNARDAMPKGGKLTIETLNAALSEDYCKPFDGLTPGDFVAVCVSDTGTGIPSDVLPKIFEPFFTTKPVGQGTGLGLATCYGVVKQSGGHIAAYSEPGMGATFKVYLPRTFQAPVAAAPPLLASPAKRCTETVLHVEDDKLIREMVLTALTDIGFNMLSADNGLTALQVARDHPNEIHLLITDVVMPKLGGRDLATQLQNERPNLRVLYTSGYTENAIVHHGVLKEGINYLGKPFTPAALIEKARALLDAPTANG